MLILFILYLWNCYHFQKRKQRNEKRGHELRTWLYMGWCYNFCHSDLLLRFELQAWREAMKYMELARVFNGYALTEIVCRLSHNGLSNCGCWPFPAPLIPRICRFHSYYNYTLTLIDQIDVILNPLYKVEAELFLTFFFSQIFSYLHAIEKGRPVCS